MKTVRVKRQEYRMVTGSHTQWPFVTGKAGPGYELDPEQVKAGEAIFGANCAICHAKDGQRNGTVIPVEEVGTDRHRVDMWTAEAAKRYNAYQADYDWGFEGFRDRDGYVAIYLDGVWLRGPYLHNGSGSDAAGFIEKTGRWARSSTVATMSTIR